MGVLKVRAYYLDGRCSIYIYTHTYRGLHIHDTCVHPYLRMTYLYMYIYIYI